MRRTILATLVLVSLGSTSCMEQNESTADEQVVVTTTEASMSNMKSFISIFEIPVTDMSRAVGFYQSILGITIEKFEMPGMQIGAFPSESQAVFGVLMQGEGYVPSSNGVTIYLDGGNDLQVILNKVEQSGGTILVPKTAHADESGFFALLLDTEGNKIGLHSVN